MMAEQETIAQVEVETLQETLSGEAEGYRRLVEMTEREREALVHNRLDDLNKVVSEKLTLATHLKEWEKRREEVTAGLARHFGLPANVSLAELAVCFEEAAAQKILALRDEFVGVVERLAKLNYINQQLLQAELVRIDATFNFIASASASASAQSNGQYYTAVGNQSDYHQPGGNLLNWRA